MKAVDTNILARMLMFDDPVQSPLADAVVRQGIFIPLTVFLETAWLLRSRYRLNRSEVAMALRLLLELPDTVIEARDGVAWAVDRFEGRGDFADFVHLVASTEMESFVTFDGSLASEAGARTPLPVETLSA